ncbi:MRPL39 [Cervus elaphus hippelaphus]|uniref:MRPL39 n=1 Tax=Cervus elaphus hippelaphus TaxID=46360 RepID=A0A212C3E7_CEREH|nr:MRPL39 [Cervus elaphus hippelaphus]
MAVVVWGLRLCRTAPSGGAAWNMERFGVGPSISWSFLVTFSKRQTLLNFALAGLLFDSISWLPFSCPLLFVKHRLEFDGETGSVATSPASQLSPTELIEMQNDLFNKEKNRQLSLTPRTEKIEVKHVGKTDPGTIFVLNKNVSTPYSCAMHLSEWYCRKSILALVDGQPWDMYKPLTKSCEIKFLTFKDDDPGEVNKAYWRSCAMIMGCVIERAFKDEYVVRLVRAPEVPEMFLSKLLQKINTFIFKENLRSFTKDARALIYKDLPFETLEVEAKVALEIFQHNNSGLRRSMWLRSRGVGDRSTEVITKAVRIKEPAQRMLRVKSAEGRNLGGRERGGYKVDFIEEKASQNPERIVKLHRFGDFIDVSEGPLIPRTSICFQYEVSAVHNLQATQSSLVRRFQGLSLPVHLRVTEDQTKPTEKSAST